MCWPNPSHASEGTECISTCIGKTPPGSTRTDNASQHVFNKSIPCQRGHKIYPNLCRPNSIHASEDIRCISTCLDQTAPIPERIQNSIWVDSTAPMPARKHKKHPNTSWPNPSHANEDSKCISTCVEQLNRWQKMHLNMCWPKLFYVNGDTKFISTGVPARTQTVSQLVLKKHNIYLRGKKCISTCTDHSHSSDNTKCISTRVDQNS